jgi:transcriptional regulator with XRE-family HTH domain
LDLIGADLIDDRLLTIGARLRVRRQELDLTLKQVAEAAGLSIGFISQVERDLTVPSLASLVSICRILKTDIGTFVQQPRPEHGYSRRSQRQPYAVSKHPLSIQYERISAEFPGSQIRSVVMNIPVGYRSELMVHEGEDLLFVLQGEISTTVDGSHVVLQVGDTIHHPSTSPHDFWNSSNELAVVLWVGTDNVFSRLSQQQ